MQKPSIGRIVHYRLTETDAELIRHQREQAAVDYPIGNQARGGQAYPAMVVAVFGNDEYVNLQVHLDGTDTYWATSRREGEAPDGLETSGGTIPPGTWCWPPRV